jgi:hypothetical protein
MRRSKALVAALMVVSLLLVLGACSSPAGGSGATWSAVTSPSQLTGTWAGTITVNVPANSQTGMPAFTQSVGLTLAYVGTSMTVTETLDMTGLLTAMGATGAAADAAWASLAAMMAQPATLDPATGMTTTITCSTGSPYVMTMTMTGAVTNLATADLTGIEINSTGTQIRFPMDAAETGISSLTLTKQ